jgi:hypothetical protein
MVTGLAFPTLRYLNPETRHLKPNCKLSGGAHVVLGAQAPSETARRVECDFGSTSGLDETTARSRKNSLLRSDTGSQTRQYVIRAGSRQEAEKIAASDPYTAAGFTAFDLIEWDVHQIMGAGPFTAAGLQGHK